MDISVSTAPSFLRPVACPRLGTVDATYVRWHDAVMPAAPHQFSSSCKPTAAWSRRPRRCCVWLALAMLSATLGGCGEAAEAAAARTDAEDAIAATSDAPDVYDAQTARFVPLAPNLDRDLLQLDLQLDVATDHGEAIWTVSDQAEPGNVSFEVGTLSALDVQGLDAAGTETPLPWQQIGSRLDVGLPAGTPPRVRMRYAFTRTPSFGGLTAGGWSVVWPTECGNLFPCHSAPADGIRFSLTVAGLKTGEVAVHAPPSAHEASAYVVALAVGAYTWHERGKTGAGTRIGYWATDEMVAAAEQGTAWLPQAFDWLEQVLGPYPYGDRAGPVHVDWGPFGYGGMEHHPYWHVGNVAMADPMVHVHEAAHGWFGSGVRLRCWEDLLLSEGVADYLMLRARIVVQNEDPEPIWKSVEDALVGIRSKGNDRVVWPQSCGVIDVKKGLFGKVTYHRGALFLHAVGALVGDPVKVDAALGSFAKARMGKAAGVQDLLDHLETSLSVDLSALAQTWLLQAESP